MIYSTYQEYMEEIKKEKGKNRIRKLFEEKIIIEDIDQNAVKLNQKEKIKFYLIQIEMITKKLEKIQHKKRYYEKIEHWLSICYVKELDEWKSMMSEEVTKELNNILLLLEKIGNEKEKEGQIKALNRLIGEIISYQRERSKIGALTSIEIEKIEMHAEVIRECKAMDII